MTKAQLRYSIYIIVGLCLLIYGNSLTNDYSFDDEYVIVNNKKVAQGFSGIPAIFKSRYLESTNQNYGYRPITLTSFAIEHGIFGATPAVSHAINLLLYIIICLLIFKILRTLFKDYHWALPLVVVILFAVHPIHTEVVDNVKSRDELLCFLFALLAMYSAIKYIRIEKSLWLAAVFLFMVLSFLSKLSALTFLAVIPLSLYFFEDIKKKPFLKIVAALILPLLLYRLINTQLIDTAGNRNLLFIENPLFVNGAGFMEKLPMAFYTIFYYLKLLVFPHPLISYYGYNHVPIVGWDHIYVWLGAIITLALAAFVVLKFRSKSVLVYGVAFFLVTISMFSNFVKPAVGIIAERFAFIPSLGFCIVLGWVLFKISTYSIPAKEKLIAGPRNYFAMGILTAVVLISSIKVFSRNTDWNNLVGLLENDLKTAPKSVKLNMLLANDLFKTATSTKLSEATKDSLMDKSIFYYTQALDNYPIHTPAHNNLGVLYTLKGETEKAHEHFLRASEDGTPDAQTFLNLGLSYRAMGDRKNAIESLKRSAELNSKNYRVYNDLLNIQYEDGDVTGAMATNLKMFRDFPNKRKEVFDLGQRMAINTYGSKTTFYIDLLLEKKLIDQRMYDNFKSQLNPSVMDKR